ncbi:MAG: hypothetical protein WC365_04310 [Candidatus Babeliales bacterium]|jgi:hypothetical protein
MENHRPKSTKSVPHEKTVTVCVSITPSILAKADEHGVGDSRSKRIAHFVKLGLESKGLL